MTYLRSYLESAEFVLRCDHRALLSVLINMSPNARINRWRLRLSEYNYQIGHKPGKDHKVAHALSRLPTEGLDTSSLDEDIPVLAVETRASDALKKASPEEAPMGALSAQEFILGRVKDDFCQARLKDSLPPPDPTWSPQAFLFWEKNGLLCRRSVYGRETQVVIPEALKERLQKHQHLSVLAGHPGSGRTYNTLRRYAYWPTMVVDLYKHVQQCPTCAKHRLSERTHTTVLELFTADEPFSGLAMDLFGPLPASKGGQKHVPVIRDRFTKLTRANTFREATALTWHRPFLIHGLPVMASPTRSLRTTVLSSPRFITRASWAYLVYLRAITLLTTRRRAGRWSGMTAPSFANSAAIWRNTKPNGTGTCPS